MGQLTVARPFERVLIANRGAVASRIITTLRRLGVGAVAVYADDDAGSAHVADADLALPLGGSHARDTYLNVERLLDIAVEAGAGAVHPGYGFLSENPGFVQRCEAEGLVFLGPTAGQIEAFGLKHTARRLAEEAGLPLLPGSPLLEDAAAARDWAERLGYPVIVKSTAGGGGIGMQICRDRAGLARAYDSARQQAMASFGDDGVYLETFVDRARHIEVQVFGDGAGGVLTLGERDCSSQRRNQKVVEEAPAPHLTHSQRVDLAGWAEQLATALRYRSAGTVEFVLDADREAFYFLEMNTRLQVEHGVTEQIYGIDLVEWMIRLGNGTLPPLSELGGTLAPRGHALQVRIYAEKPFRAFEPSTGEITGLALPDGAAGPVAGERSLRVDHALLPGLQVSANFDPMLAKVITTAPTRAEALSALQQAVAGLRIDGVETNSAWLGALLADPAMVDGRVTTRYLDRFEWPAEGAEVLAAGTQTTIQDWPGRVGYWQVGVPPSGPFDDRALRLANRLLGNPEGAAGLEMAVSGPTLRFGSATTIALTGAPMEATLDGQPVPYWQAVDVAAGATLAIGRLTGGGMRSYLAVAGGFDCPRYLGARATFTLGQFGGYAGRALRVGDLLRWRGGEVTRSRLAPERQPDYPRHWTLRVLPGPHSAPDYFAPEDIEALFDTDWEVHYNSSRTGVRLIGPKPRWARRDGGEAGLHPSNIHDNAYALGTIDFTGDMPVLLGPDGPSLGGFVCPATVITADRGLIGQLKAGDRLRFEAVDDATAVAARAESDAAIAALEPLAGVAGSSRGRAARLAEVVELEPHDVTVRAAGDEALLLEFGANVLDLRSRFRVHALMDWLNEQGPAGIRELTPGIRSLQVQFDPRQLSRSALLDRLQEALEALAAAAVTRVPSRVLHLPLSWNDEVCHQAVQHYMQAVRGDAPWCPDNVEFIRRINGLDDVADVKRIVFDASYLVMGLGDVYLGAPVATPVDPRHRLVTTKYNPARTWTAENSVGIGGSYLCIYGMEGPGGYQFVGRTVQVWSRYRRSPTFTEPWLLRFFDRIRFFEVSHEELLAARRDFPLGRYPLRVEDSEFDLDAYDRFLNDNAAAIESFRQQRAAAFDAELQHWHATGQYRAESEPAALAPDQERELAAHLTGVESPVAGSLWRLLVEPGAAVAAGDVLALVESMKMEIEVRAPCAGVVDEILVQQGGPVHAGALILALAPAPGQEQAHA